MEMGRRFLLVGLFVVWPFKQGQIMQVAVANLTAIIYLVFQVPDLGLAKFERLHALDECYEAWMLDIRVAREAPR